MDKKVLHSVIQELTKLQGNSIAIEAHGKKVSYQELESRSNQIANCLLEEKIDEGKVIGVYLESGIEYVSCLLGINKAGGIFMPLEPSYPIKRLEYLIGRVAPQIIITEDKSLDKLLSLIGSDSIKHMELPKLVVVSDTGQIKVGEVTGTHIKQFRGKFYSKEAVGLLVNGDSSNYLLYTSGSTGQPKIIEGCHKSLSHFIHWEKEEFKLGTEVRVSQLAPTTFDVSLRDIFVPLLAGGTLCIPDMDVKAEPLKLLKWISSAKISLMHTVPSMFRLITKELRENPEILESLKDLKYILLAGEPVYGKDIKAWRDVAGLQTEIVNLYGPTETTLAKIFNRIKHLPEDLNAIIPLGKPITSTGIIVSKNNRLCDVGAIGEIFIKTPFMTKGYYKDSTLTKERFVQNPLHNDHEDIVYKTGDLGKYQKDDTIAFIGRQDSQVKIRGNRVELTEVERVLSGFDGIDQAIVLSIKKTDGEDVLACYYTEKHSIEEGQVKQHLHNYLPEYMHPSYYIRLDEFPLNVNGKTDRRALPSPEALLYEQLTFVPADNEMERELSGIWAEVLGLKKVGVTNSFFELGGHSLSATKVVSRIYKKLGKEVSLKDFFDHSTIRNLAKFIKIYERSEYVEIKPVGYQSYYDLSHAQKLIWILQQSESKMTAYNMSGSYILNGGIDIIALKKALKTLVQRHETLRTQILLVEGEPKQKVRDEVNFEIYETDESSEEENFILNKYIKEEHAQSFNLSEDLLFRAKLIKLNKKRYLFLFTMHHIISDGWSRGVLANDILELYKAYKNGEEHSLQPLKIQYKDYVAWHNSSLSGEKLNKDRKYWHNQLSGDIPLINLPYDYPRSEIRSHAGAKYSFVLGKEDSEAIKQICNANELSLFTFLLALIKVVLYNYSGQKQILIGTPISGRNHIDLEKQIGIFLNNLTIRSEIQNQESFKEFLMKVKKTVLEAYQHQNFPYDTLVEELEIDYKSNRNPLYDVMVVMDNPELNGSKKDMDELADLLNMEEVNIEDTTSKLDLTFFIKEEVQEIRIIIEYKSELFKIQTIEKIKEAFLLLARELSNNIHITIDEAIWIFSEDIEQKLLKSTIGVINDNF